MNRTLVIVGIGSAAVAATAGVAFSGGQQVSSKPAAAPASVSARFAPFRRAQTPADKLPGAPMPGAVGDLQPGEHPELSRALRGPGGVTVGYIWPKDNGVCIAIETTSTCGTLQQIADLGALIIKTPITSQPGAWRVAGVKADSTSDVRLSASGTSAQSVQQFENGFVGTVRADPAPAATAKTGTPAGTTQPAPPPPVTVSWADAQGNQRSADQ